MKNKRNLISLMLTILMPMYLFGQEAVIEEKIPTGVSGVVADESGVPLVGANVVVEGTDLGAAANADGAYTIDIGAGSYILTASAIGYASLSVNVEVKEDEELMINFYKNDKIKVSLKRDK